MRTRIEREWRCLGFFGYGAGAAFREADARRDLQSAAEYGPCNPTRGICPQIELCRGAHARRADRLHPEAAVLAGEARSVELEEFLEEGTWIALLKLRLREKFPNRYLVPLPNGRSRLATHYDAVFYENLERGAEGKPPEDSAPTGVGP